MCLWPTVMAHTNYVMHAAGWLEGGLTISFEKFILDVEQLAMLHHLLGGVALDDDALALDTIAEVGPGGHHFGTAHTLERYDGRTRCGNSCWPPTRRRPSTLAWPMG
jgi:trimethylamine---corrinoid protein Co-methyltransferase